MKKCPYCAEKIQNNAYACLFCGKNLRSESSVVFFWGPPSSGLIGFFGRLDIVIDGFPRGKVGFLKLAKFNINSGNHEVVVNTGKNTSTPLIFTLSPGEEKHFICKLKEDLSTFNRPLFTSEETLEITEYIR